MNHRGAPGHMIRDQAENQARSRQAAYGGCNGKDSFPPNPMEIKKKLAERIVTELHGAIHAKNASGHFQRTVQDKEIPDEVVNLNISKSTIIDENFLLEQKIVASKSEGKQLISQGGVTLNGEKVTGQEQGSKNDIIKVGKRRVFKL
jgi:tyrosyl-tRNA synthetase